jgi:hypothetical protein
MGPWNLAGGPRIFRFYYCICLQVRRYSEDGSSMFLRSTGPFCWTTRCHNSEGRRLKFYSQESVAPWTGILRLFVPYVLIKCSHEMDVRHTHISLLVHYLLQKIVFPSSWSTQTNWPFEAYRLLYVSPGITPKNSTWWLHCVCVFCMDPKTNSNLFRIQH